MLTLDDIKYVTFRKSSIGGYRPEDVDKFIDEVISSYKALLDMNEDLKNEINLLNEKVTKYRDDEELIRGALINAQKISDASVREAKHKSEVIIKDACDKADNIILDAERKIVDKKNEFDVLKEKVNSFRTDLLNSYKEHLKLIDALPSVECTEDVKSDSFESDGNGINIDEKLENELENNISSTELNEDIEFEFSILQTIDNTEDNNEKDIELKFGENYNIKDEESPVGLFNKN